MTRPEWNSLEEKLRFMYKKDEISYEEFIKFMTSLCQINIEPDLAPVEK